MLENKSVTGAKRRAGTLRELASKFKQYRIGIAREILGNIGHIIGMECDIQSVFDVCELLDEYAIRVLVEWLHTRFGADIYAQNVKTENGRRANGLCDLLEKTEHFPFLNCVGKPSDNDGQKDSFQLLDQLFEPRVDLIGSLYEDIVNRPLSLGHDRRIDIGMDTGGRDKRRTAGQFYTPPHIVRYCYQCFIESDSNKFMSDLKTLVETARGERSRHSKQHACAAKRILDPACGTGNFLVGALRTIADELAAPESEYLIQAAKHCLYGVEVDGRAAALARVSILLELTRLGCGPERLPEVFTCLRKNIIVSDSIYDLTQKDFDLVITNPPYVSYGARNQPEIALSQKQALKLLYPESADYKVRLHSIFQELAVRLCKPGGSAVLLVPDAFLTGSFYARLRRKIFDRAQIVSLSELPGDTIGGAVVGRWCVAHYRANTSASSSAPGETTAARAAQSGDSDVRLFEVSSAGERTNCYAAKASSIVSPHKNRWRLVFCWQDEQILGELDQLPTLGTMLRGHTGMRALSGQSSIVSGARQGADWQRGIKSGAQVIPFQASWDGTWLCVNERYLYKGGFDADVVGNPKILVRQTGDRLIAALDVSGLYHLNNVHSFSDAKVVGAQRRADLPFFTALMNSSLWLYLYQLTTRERARVLAQIDIETVESMPLPVPTARQELALRVLADVACDRSRAKLHTFVRGAIDRLVYDLYGITDGCVAHIESYCRMASKTDCTNGRMNSLPSVEAAYELARTAADARAFWGEQRCIS